MSVDFNPAFTNSPVPNGLPEVQSPPSVPVAPIPDHAEVDVDDGVHVHVDLPLPNASPGMGLGIGDAEDGLAMSIPVHHHHPPLEESPGLEIGLKSPPPPPPPPPPVPVPPTVGDSHANIPSGVDAAAAMGMNMSINMNMNMNMNVNTATNSTDANTSTSTNSQKLIKARKSFSLKEKIACVVECQSACSSNHNSRKKSKRSRSGPGSGSGIGSASSSSSKEHERKKSYKLKSWLKEKNERDGTNIAYGTFYKWFQRYGNMEHDDAELCSMGNLKRVRKRPFAELESVLVQYLRVRNQTLRSQGLPASNASFIKEKASMFHRDMYGDGPSEFKGSNGWVQRFRNRYMYIIDPEGARNQEMSNEELGTGGENDLDLGGGTLNNPSGPNNLIVPTLNDALLQNTLVPNQASGMRMNNNSHQLQIGEDGTII